MTCDATEHSTEYTRVGLENLLNPVDEDVVTEDQSTKQLWREIAGVNNEENEDIVTEEADNEESLTVCEELQHLAHVGSSLERHAELCNVSRSAYHNCRRTLRLKTYLL